MTCIRRSYSRWTTCPCEPCTDDRNRLTKLHRNGRVGRVSSEAAWAVVDRRLADGWSPEAIASASGLTGRYLLALMESDRQGKRAKIGPNRAAAIVGMTNIPTAGRLNVTGARRRLQALAMMGHSVAALSERSGVHRTTLHVIKSGRTKTVYAIQHAAVVALYDALNMTRGDSKETAAAAAARGYAPPAAWDNIDDPRESPVGVLRVAKRSRDNLMEDIAELADTGETVDAIAARLGMTTSGVEKFLHREKGHDLLERIRRNDRTLPQPGAITYKDGRRIVAHVAGASGMGPDAGSSLRRAS